MTMPDHRRRRKGQSGNSMVEVAFLAPWIFFLFVGIFDAGFFAFAAICTENAARAAATQTAASQSAQSDLIACNAAWKEMNLLLNVATLSQDCTQLPVKVVRRTLCTQASVVPTTITCETPCATLTPPRTTCVDCSVDVTAASSEVCVTYQGSGLAPIPGILTNQITLTRTAEMRILAQ
jgi:Flp pilus assembly protein TadG